MADACTWVKEQTVAHSHLSSIRSARPQRKCSCSSCRACAALPRYWPRLRRGRMEEPPPRSPGRYLCVGAGAFPELFGRFFRFSQRPSRPVRNPLTDMKARAGQQIGCGVAGDVCWLSGKMRPKEVSHAPLRPLREHGLGGYDAATRQESCAETRPGLRAAHSQSVRGGGGGGRSGMHWKGGRYPTPTPSRAPSRCPATVPLTPSAGLNGICNRQ